MDKPINYNTTEGRKKTPIFRGLLMYFPDACIEIAQCSYLCNEQHNPGEEMHWAKEKSSDHEDALTRHLMESGTIDTDGIRHSTKTAWRALALLQTEIEKEQCAENTQPVKALPLDLKMTSNGMEHDISGEASAVIVLSTEQETAPHVENVENPQP